MSSSSEVADIVSAFANLRIDYSAGYSAAALVVYDFLITVDRELEVFRTWRLTGASVLFLTTRYVTLIYQILGVVRASLIDPSPTTCNVLVNLGNSLDWFHMFPLAVFSAMRAYAITTNRILTVVVFVLSLAPVALNFATYAYGSSGLPGTLQGCVSLLNMTKTEIIIFTVTSRGSLILADAMLAIATAVNLSGAKAPWGRGTSLVSVMLHDGLFYFVVLTILNILHLSFTLASVFETGVTSNITLFTDPIATILTYRFLLDLQETNQRDVKLESDHPLHFAAASDGTPSFVRAPDPTRQPERDSPVAGGMDYQPDSEEETMRQGVDTPESTITSP